MIRQQPAAAPTRPQPRKRTQIPLDVLPPAKPTSPGTVADLLINRPYLSYSAVSTYQRCPLRFFFAYVAGLQPEFRASSLVFGGAIHAAIEHHYRCLLEGQPAPPLDDLLAEFDRASAADITVPIRYGKNETPESLRELASRMLAAFRSHDLSRLDTSSNLIGVEEELRGLIIDDCPEILGRLDLVASSRNALRIFDFKTSRSRWDDSQIEEAAPQQLLYAELAKPLAESLGLDQIQIGWIVLTKTKQPTIELHTLMPEQREIDRVKRIVLRVWQAIAEGHFYPAPSTMNCSGCPHRNACRNWEG